MLVMIVTTIEARVQKHERLAQRYRQILDSPSWLVPEQVYRVTEKNVRTHRSSLKRRLHQVRLFALPGTSGGVWSIAVRAAATLLFCKPASCRVTAFATFRDTRETEIHLRKRAT